MSHISRRRPVALTAAAATALLLAACSNNPDSFQPLADLQAELAQLRQSQMPALVPTGFAEAEVALSRAERALGDVPLEELRHLTSLAQLRLETARAEAAAAAARQERDQLLAERRVILGRAREKQLEAERQAPPDRMPAAGASPGPSSGPSLGSGDRKGADQPR